MSSIILALACVAFAIVLSRLMKENAALKEQVKEQLKGLQQGRGSEPT